MRDLVSDIHPVRVLSPQAARTDNTAIIGQVVDGFGFDSVSYLLNIGANTDVDATFDVQIEESDAAVSGFAAVADSDLIGTETASSFTFDDDNELRKIGYRGSKRFTRLAVTPSGNDSGNIFVSAVAVLGHPRSAPTPTLS